MPGVVVRDESAWLATLRALDEPGEPGQSAGLEFPRGFDVAATQLRFERLSARLSEVFGCRLDGGTGPCQDAALFGEIRIPPEFTVTRAKRSRIRFPVIVAVSNFGDLATCRAGQDSVSPDTLTSAAPPVHPEDRGRVEQVLNELGYLFVPADVLETRYDGPNQWVFSDSHASWFIRYFSFL